MKQSLIILILSLSCSRAPLKDVENALRKVQTPTHLYDDLEIAPFIQAIEKNIRALKKRPNKVLRFGEREIKAQDYAKSLSQIISFYQRSSSKESTVQFIKENFQWNEVYGKSKWGEILMTSYYEPIYPGRKSSIPPYTQPIYPLPKDLVEVQLHKFKGPTLNNLGTDKKKVSGRLIEGFSYPKVIPFYDRKEIDIDKKLDTPPLYFLDPIHAFFLQIQGSGAIKLPNGQVKRVGYAGQNGHIYESIGRFLYHKIPREEMSLQRIESYLRSLSKRELYQFLTKNPSYVFFKNLKTGKGRTTLGTEVVAGRTIAIDSSLFPLGSLAHIEFPKPIFKNSSSTVPEDFKTTSRFVLAQDTGGAIKSAGRADLFWGEGEAALQSAGVMRHKAKLWFLTPKETK